MILNHYVERLRVRRRPIIRLVFIAIMASTTSLINVGVPVYLAKFHRDCRDFRCVNVTQEIQGGMQTSANPCTSFYDFVCSNWASSNPSFASPSAKYSSRIADVLLEDLIREKREGARQKAAELLVRCLRPQPDIAALREFLHKHKLTWPFHSPSSTKEIFDIITGISLDDGIPILVPFTVGRDLENRSLASIYAILDSEFMVWVSHIQQLKQKRRVFRFLRRCAEIVGVFGASYNKMIVDVLTVHDAILNATVNTNDYESFQTYNIDVQVIAYRTAINKNVPDRWQLWPGDHIRGIAPRTVYDLMYLFNGTYASDKVKQYIGAYVVWYLIPFTSPDLTESLLSEMGRRQYFSSYMKDRCFSLLSSTMPMVVWKMVDDHIPSQQRDVALGVLGSVKKLMIQALRSMHTGGYTLIEPGLSRLSLHPFQQTYKWDAIDDAYSYLPRVQMRFFASFLQVCRTSMARMKRSKLIRKADDFPAVDIIPLYRLLIFNQVLLQPYYFFPPFLLPHTPPERLLSTLGVRTAFQATLLSLAVLVRYVREHGGISAVSEAASPIIKCVLDLSHDSQRKDPLGGNKITGIAEHMSWSTMYLAVALSGDDLGAMSTWLPSYTREQTFFISACATNCQGTMARPNDKNRCDVPAKLSPWFSRAFRCPFGTKVNISSLCNFINSTDDNL